MQRPLIEAKAAQGFTRLLMVPQTTTVNSLTESLRQAVYAHAKTGNLHDNRGEPVQLPASGEVYANPAELTRLKIAETNDRHHQHTLASSTPGWKVALVKNMPELPHTEEDVVVFAGRGEFMMNLRSPKDTLKVLRNNPVCAGESGFTAEMWIMYSLSELERSGTVVDAHGNTLLFGSTSAEGIFGLKKWVPIIGWGKVHAKGASRETYIQVQTAPPRTAVFDAGVRTAVTLS